MAYIGKVKERLELVVTVVGDYTFVSSFGYRETLNHIYTMKDEENNVFVWKTSNDLVIETVTEEGFIEMDFAKKGDKIRIKGTVKEHNEYRNEPQTVLTRCKVLAIVERALTKEEKQELKKQEQLATLTEGDIIYNMKYSQYKKHYADCETLAGSYDYTDSTIDVIVREGRLKASGVRGKRFSDFLFRHENGAVRCIYAVSFENAWKRLEKEYKNTEGWKLEKEIPSGSYKGWY